MAKKKNKPGGIPSGPPDGSEKPRACRICGCTEDRACLGGCSWIEDDLCSNPECIETASTVEVAEDAGEIQQDEAPAEESGTPVDLEPPLGPGEAKEPPSGGAKVDPTSVLKQIVLGELKPQDVAGARVSFHARPTKWRDAIALRIDGIDAKGTVFLDLECGGHAATHIPLGDGVGCWKLRAG